MGKKIFEIPDEFLLEMIRWYLTLSQSQTKLPREYEIEGVYYNKVTECWEVTLQSFEFTNDEEKEDLSEKK